MVKKKNGNLNQLDIETNAIFAVGDIHGVFNSLVSTLARYDLRDSMIICCGDCGLGFYKPDATKLEMNKLNKACKERNMKIVMVRGNHDNPKFFEEGLINTKYIIAVPDYTVVNGKILCVGGATSIDRRSRIEDKEIIVRHYQKYHPGCTLSEAYERTSDGYWEDEAPVFNPDALNELKEKGISIKHVITHTCPSFCDPTSKDGIMDWAKDDPTLLETVDNERHVMDMLYEKLREDGHPLETWTYGHYHRHNAQEYDNIKFTMLGAILRGNTYPDWVEIIDKEN